MRVERHIFGSYSGYGTLACSPGVTGEDQRALEKGAYAFGQPSDLAVLRGLGRSPSYFTRPLSAGRRGLTRVLEGRSDDNGRPTLLLITAIVGQSEWDGILGGDVAQLLDAQQLWQFDGNDCGALDITITPAAHTVPRKVVPKVLALLSEADRAQAQRRNVVVTSDEFSIIELQAIEVLVPPAARSRFSSAYRSFNGSLPVTINCVAAETGAARPTFRYRPNQPLSQYARLLREAGLATGVVPVELVTQCRTFGMAEQTLSLSVTVPEEPLGTAIIAAPGEKRGFSGWALAACGLGALLAGGAGFCIGSLTGSTSGTLRERALREAEMRRTLVDTAQDYEGRLHRAFDVPATDFDQMLKTATEKLAAARSEATTALARAQAAEARAAAPASQAAIPPPPPGDLQGKRERLWAAYQAMAKRCQERFTEMRPDILPYMEEVNHRKLMEKNQEIQRIHRDLSVLDSDWSLLKDGAKWPGELRTAQERFADLADAAQKLTRVRESMHWLSQSIEDLKRGRSLDLETLKDLRQNADQVKQAIEELQGFKRPGILLAAFANTQVDELGKMRGEIDRAFKAANDEKEKAENAAKKSKEPVKKEVQRNSKDQRGHDLIPGGIP